MNLRGICLKTATSHNHSRFCTWRIVSMCVLLNACRASLQKFPQCPSLLCKNVSHCLLLYVAPNFSRCTYAALYQSHNRVGSTKGGESEVKPKEISLWLLPWGKTTYDTGMCAPSDNFGSPRSFFVQLLLCQMIPSCNLAPDRLGKAITTFSLLLITTLTQSFTHAHTHLQNQGEFN